MRRKQIPSPEMRAIKSICGYRECRCSESWLLDKISVGCQSPNLGVPAYRIHLKLARYVMFEKATYPELPTPGTHKEGHSAWLGGTFSSW